ncbi:Signal recognition particle, subunit Srp19 [Phaffia rhodozyma]|uniref:Signal recognition particle, subunit Srp19 n=1 Tax=Phaffia rhodozyma TaxID=264483 RepID=A0A0F7SQB6_PHARH|nr:Signal recognition particle, subunit Srp19 [Phaffia rhodozyma]
MAARIEEYDSSEEFNDDTDLPLPSSSLPNLGDKGSILEEITPSGSSPSSSVPASAPEHDGAAENPMANFQAMMQALAGQDQSILQRQTEAPGVQYVDDTAPFKEWHPIYPIYLDAKRAYGNKGGRRVPRDLAVWWPVSKDIAAALKALHLPVFHEQLKTHPKDWANPGRVKTEYFKDGRYLHPRIKTRQQLYVEVARQMARLPSSVPQPKPTITPAPASTSTPAPTNASTSTPKKTQKVSGKKATATSTSTSTQKPPRRRPTGLARPPKPLPPAEERVSEFSPTIPGGHFLQILKREKVEADKRKVEAEKAAAANGGLSLSVGREIESSLGGDGKKEGKEKKPKMKIMRGGKR